MSDIYKVIRIMLFLYLTASFQQAYAQAGVLNPNDPIVVYNPSAPPATPAYGTMVKWVKTNRLTWNTSSFKCYFYKNIAFRLKFPKSYQHGVNDGKKYPVFVFFHGIGESGTIYDNEYQLYHGGQFHMNAVDNGTFDGFLLYPQSVQGTWTNQFGIMNEIIQNYLVPQVKADPWRICVDGLSGGGGGAWKMMIQYPKTVAASLPISNSNGSYTSGINNFKYTPVWQFQGALDPDPSLSSTQSTANTILNAGANFKLTVYPNLGHGCWNTAWREPDFYPFMLRAYKSNPWALYGRTEFCSSDNINITVGVTPGYTSYEWRKNGAPISGATGNAITVTSVGSYDCRINNNGQWSEWSRIPLVVKYKSVTITPDIKLSANSSGVLPTIDGSDGVKLELPDGYASYEWRKDNTSSSVIGTNRFLTATSPGNYYAKVTEQYGCSSAFSDAFKVIDGNAPNGPAAPTSFNGQALGITSAKLTWNQQATPAYNETGFEIYQGASSSGPYTLIKLTAADAPSFTVNNLKSFTEYYFKIRAINNNAASQPVGPILIRTLKDTISPSTPANLKVTSFTRTQVDLSWGASSDDVGVVGYDVYINGVKSYTTTNTYISAYALATNKTYNFVVKARDQQGNASVPSNQVTASTYSNGLGYRFYTGTWSSLPDFNLLTPAAFGQVPNVSLSPATIPNNYGLLFQGYITIKTSGSYTFRLSSDDGSKLYLNLPYTFAGTSTINNDGTHALQNRDATLTLSAGSYPITIVFFQAGSSAVCNFLWKTPGTSSFVAVPDDAFKDNFSPAGTAPSAPISLGASALAYNKINVHWTDNSNNETGFEIFRATSSSGNFVKIGTSAANTGSFADTTVFASTTYYYKIRSIGQYGESAYVGPANATTPASPGAAAVPLNLVAHDESSSSIRLTWSNNDPSVSKFELYRSSPDNSFYTQVAVIPGNSTAYSDSNLSANTVYYYKLRAYNGVYSAFGNETSKTTLDNLPVLEEIGDRSIGYGRQSSIAVTATDADGEVLTFSFNNLPAFASFTATGNGTGTLNFNPQAADVGTYNNVRVIVKDQHGGADTSSFNLTVNSNPAIVLDNISNVTVAEEEKATVNLTGNYSPSDNITITTNNLPSFGTLIDNGNNSFAILLSPVTGQRGVYNNVIVTATNANGESSSQVFTITVTETATTNIYLNFNPASGGQPGIPWNSMGGKIAAGSTWPDLKDTFGVATGVTMTLVDAWDGTATNGAVTNDNTGIFPDAIMKTLYYSTATTTRRIQISGLSTSGKYDFIFFASRSGNAPADDNRTTQYTIGSQSVSLAASPSNTSRTVEITGVSPNSSGIINIGVLKDPGSIWAHLNVMIIKAAATTTGSTTATPTGLTASGISTSKIKLNWTAVPGNPSAVEVWRANTSNGAFVKITTLAGNAVTYTDDNLPATTTYHYKLRAVANSVVSAFSTAAAGTTLANATAAPPVNISATGISSDKIRIDWSAATGTETGFEIWRSASENGTYTKIATVAGNVFTYTDQNLALTTTYYYKLRSVVNTTFSLYSSAVNATTLDNNIPSIYVNFSTAGSTINPWNSTNGVTAAGSTFSNLKDATGAGTGMGMKLVQGWTTATSGATTNTNSGIYPDAVMKTLYYDAVSSVKNILFTNLSSSRKYDFTFFASRSGNAPSDDNRITWYSIGTQTVSLAASPSNTSRTVQIRGISPDANGQIQVNIQRDAGAVWAQINAMVITPRLYDGTPYVPENLTGSGIGKDKIKLNWALSSIDQTGIEVWRSTSENGTYNLVTTLGSSVTTYTNSGLSSGTVYFYKLRTVKNGAYSAYTTPAGAATLTYNLNLNFNDGSSVTPSEKGAWNNTNALISDGFILSNLISDEYVNTGIKMKVVNNFSGYNTLGAVTGNNSGLYSDNVIKGFYYVNYLDTARLQFLGLNHGMIYTFSFFGSTTYQSGTTTVYRIGNKTATLDSWQNISRTTSITNVVPDENGSVLITIYSSLGYGYMNELSIQGAPSPYPSTLRRIRNNTLPGVLTGNNRTVNDANGNIKIAAYPNPFIEDIILKMDLKNDVDNLTVQLTGVDGAAIQTFKFKGIKKGKWQQRIGLHGKSLSSGIYLLNVNVPGEKPHIIKLKK